MKKKKKWLGQTETCDICHGNLRAYSRFVDGRTIMGPWALMCERCYLIYGKGLGTGVGQMYNSETLEKVAG